MADQNAMPTNMAYRNLVIQTATKMKQLVSTETIASWTPGSFVQRNIAIKNVGLTTKLYLQISVTIAQAAAETLTRTTFGPANLISNLTFADYSNYQRINTTGWHLDALATARAKMPFATAYTTSNPIATGSIFNVKSAPASITTAQTVYMIYEIPLAYSDANLQGAVLSQVLNGNAYLSFTINPNMIVASTGNPVQAVYQSSTAGNIGVVTNFTWTLYQEFYDQLPQDQKSGALMLPANDLSYVYGVYNTDMSGIAVSSDNPYSFTNYRAFMSVFAIYDNAGVLNAGTDMNRMKLIAANMTPIFDLSPEMVKLFERKIIGDDFPLGSYYFDFRDKPITTSQNGNMQLMFNPKVVTSNASVFHLGLEYLAELNQVAQAGSILA